MKKVLEGELLSLAHRVLQLKDKEIDSLFKEAKELYEKLLVLKFYQDHLDEGRIKDVSPEQLNDALKALAISNLNESKVDENIRHQMPIDLIEEDYPIVAEAEKEVVSTLDSHLIADSIIKISPEVVEETPVVTKIVTYDEPFITDVYIDESTTAEDDAQLHNYLDQHEAMLKQVEERNIDLINRVDSSVETEEDLMDDVEVTAIYEDKRVSELEGEDNIIIDSALVEKPGVEEHLVITVEDSLNDNHFVDSDNVHVEVGSLENTLEGINQQFASAKIDEPTQDLVQEPFSKVIEERTSVDGQKKSSDDPFFGFDFSDVEFVRVESLDENTVSKFDNQFESIETQKDLPKAEEKIIQSLGDVSTQKVEVTAAQSTLFNVESTSVREPKILKSKSLNDIYNTTIVVGLNDRIAFERHLFNGSAEDFNRVLSQLNTVSSFDEANSLIEHLVKPEYNNWDGKEEYAERFMALVEKRFI